MATDDPTSADSLAPGIDYVPRLMTAADLAEMPSDLPTGPVRYELDNGVLITMSPPGFEHCYSESEIAAELKSQGQAKGFGLACSGDVAIILHRNPDAVVGADAAFICSAQLPLKLSREGYLETIPDLVVEVLSKNDRRSYVTRKVTNYLKAGVKVVWTIDPAKRSINEFRTNSETKTYEESATLELQDLIPGFQYRVADLFRNE